jgi:hypothetical protein
MTEEHGEVEWGGVVPRGRELFPKEWGTIPLDPDVRAAWILRQITLGQLARAGGAEVRWLHIPTPQEVQLALIANVESPALAAARREVVLAASKAAGRLLELQAQQESRAP